MPVASELLVRINADTGNLERGLSSADKQVSGFAKSAGALGGVATAAFVGLGAAAVGLGAGFGASISAASSFEATLSQVGAVSGATKGELAGLSALALQMGADTSFSAGEAAQAMAELAKGGIAVGDMASVLPGTLNLAAAGGLGLAQAATIATDTMSIFSKQGVSMDQVANAFAGAANISSISVQDMAESMKYVGPVASSMGISLEDTSAAIALLGANGLKGSQAGTGLRTMLVSLASPSKEAAGLMKDLGINMFDSGGKIKDMAGISGELKTALAGMTDQQRLATLETLFGKEGMSAAIAMMGEGENSIQSYTQKLAAAATAEATGKAMLDNFAGSMEALKGSVETAAITLGMAFLPVLRQLVDAATGAVNAALPFIKAWGPQLAAGLQAGIAAIPGIIATVQAFGAAIAATFGALGSGDFSNVFGPIITAISLAFGPETAGKVTLFVSSLVTGLNLARDAVITAKQAFSGDWISADSIATPVRLIGEAFTLLGDGVRTVQGFLAGLPAPVLAAAAGFIALGPAVSVVSAVLPLLIGAFTGLGPVIGVLTSTLPLLGSVIAAIGLPITLLIAAVAALGIAWATNFMGIQQAAAGPIAAIGALITGTLIPAVQQGIAFIAPLVAQMGTAFQTAFATISPVLQQIGAGLLAFGTSVGPIFATLGGLIVSSLGPAITALVNFGSVIIPQIALAFANLMQQVGPVLTTLAALITANMTTIQTVMTSAWTIITTIISTAFTVITSLVTAFVQVLSGDFSGAWTTIEAMVGTVWTNIQTLVMAGVTAITAMLSAFAGAIAPLLQSAWDGITSAVSSAWSAITSAVQSGVDAVTSTVGGWASSLGSTVGYVWAEIQATVRGAWEGIKATVIEAVQGILSGIQSGWAAVTGAVQSALDTIKSVIDSVWNAIPEDIRADLELIVSTVRDRFAAKLAAIQEAMTTIGTAISTGWTTITTAIGTALTTIGTAVTTGWTTITTAITTAMTTIGTTIDTAWATISTTIGTAMTTIGSAIDTAWSGISSAIGTALSGIGSAIDTAWSSVSTATSTAWTAFVSTITTQVSAAVSKVQGFGDSVASALSGIVGTARSGAAAIGQAIIDGISGAISAGAGALASIAGDVVRGALDAAKGALGIHSPSKEFAYVGQMAMAGLAGGIDEGSGDVDDSLSTVIGGFVDQVKRAFGTQGGILQGTGTPTQVMGAVKREIGDAFDLLLGGMQDAIEKAQGLVQYAKNLKTEAEEYVYNMEAAARLFAQGMAIGGATASGTTAAVALHSGEVIGNSIAQGARNALQIHSPSQVMATIGNQVVAGLVQGMGANAQDAAKKAAEVAKGVADAVQATLGALKALGGLQVASLPGGDQVGGFVGAIKQVVAALGEAAGAASGKGLDAAAKYAESAGKIMSFVGGGTEALGKLATAALPTTAAVYRLDVLIRAAVDDFAVMAERVGTEMLGLAADFATGAGAVVDTVGKGADAFTKLATYVAPAPTAIYALGKTMTLVVQDFAAIADLLGTRMVALAATFAEGGGKVAETVGKGVAGLVQLATFAAPAPAMIYAFGKTIMLVVQDFAAIADQIGVVAVADAARFAEGAGKVVATVGAGITGFLGLAKFSAPTQATMDAFLATVRYTVARFAEMATTLDADGAKATSAFSDAAAKSMGAVGAGVTAFKDMATLVLPVPAAIDDLVNTIRYAVGQVAAAAGLFGGDTLAAATAFGTAASGVFAALKSGLDLFTALGKLDAPLTTNWLDPLVQLMGGVLTRSATLVTQAQQLKSDADLFSATLGQAFAGFTNAGGGFGGGLGLGSPVPVAVPNGGGGGGGGGGGTTNVYVTITGNTLLSDDPATADALARLLKPRLAQVGGY